MKMSRKQTYTKSSVRFTLRGFTGEINTNEI